MLLTSSNISKPKKDFITKDKFQDYMDKIFELLREIRQIIHEKTTKLSPSSRIVL